MKGGDWSNDLFENAVASVVDFSSILVAYQIGVSNFGIGTGVMYGFFDAFMVVWMRKPIARFARWANPLRRSWLAPSADGRAPPVRTLAEFDDSEGLEACGSGHHAARDTRRPPGSIVSSATLGTGPWRRG